MGIEPATLWFAAVLNPLSYASRAEALILTKTVAGVAQRTEYRPVNQKVGWFGSRSGHRPVSRGPGSH